MNTHKKGIMKSPEFANVRATYRAISTLRKGGIDSNAPKTFSLIRTLSTNRKTRQRNMTEHLQNIQSLQRRMERIYKGNLVDRKKNHFDCVAYPSLFFRRSDELAPGAENFSNSGSSSSRPQVLFLAADQCLENQIDCTKRAESIISAKSKRILQDRSLDAITQKLVQSRKRW